MATGRNPQLAMVLAVAGVIALVVAGVYAFGNVSFLAGSAGHHYKHAAAFIVLAVLCFVGWNFMRQPEA